MIMDDGADPPEELVASLRQLKGWDELARSFPPDRFQIAIEILNDRSANETPSIHYKRMYKTDLVVREIIDAIERLNEQNQAENR